ncbi:imidazolonepropionase-like amidohydrolase [Cryobacterium mesophilum]|uniref:Amidohydrolase n=1 Tax=Terrimesophilobacter mesophilus TaxID=433647 RepID=A0A4R8VDU2_9MICO|nr:amidohydrolase family protein [Terrimesophilobacter mesophilus]MBB5633264.1 imidazolonepropionase-like amidohydrolase [Terrimesophilobacter mesophilus]TFB80007.1 amidohydrolase [Terrimesophilobacter mesophilus]
MTVFTVDELWLDGWRGRAAVASDGSSCRLARPGDPHPEGHLEGTVFPGFRDSHVHLGLIDGTRLMAGGIAAVDDFGWSLDVARGWPGAAGLPIVTMAGQLLTAPGGYPTASGWAPPGAALEIDGPDAAAAAVDAQLEAGAGFIKVALNSDAGPVLSDDTLNAVVARAHERRVIVAAHAQGVGQAQRAFGSGVDRLAHTPWSERLSDELLSAMSHSTTWVSTLDIHGWGDYGDDFATASDNLRRFHAAGGRIRYGTDLGNGPLPLGVNKRELLSLERAGLDPDALAAAIAPAGASGLGRYLSHIPPDGRERSATWISSARLIDTQHIKEHLT